LDIPFDLNNKKYIQMKLLVVLSRFPYPLEKGDKLRAYHQLKYLSENHDIYLIALNDKKLSEDDINAVKSFCKKIYVMNLCWWTKLCSLILFFFKGLPLQCGYFYHKKAHQKIHQLIKTIQPDHIYGQLVRVAEYIKKEPFQKTIDYQDVLSKGMDRRAQAAPWYLKPFFKMEYKWLAKYEADIFSYFDNHTIITGVDRDLIQHSDSCNIEIVANGVDFEKFKSTEVEKEFDLIFTGNMNYVPNVDAVLFLVNTIFPELKKKFPALTLAICGANPAAKVKALARKDILVTGWVRDMNEYYTKSRIFVAPMQLGTGLQNKLLEAMASGIPCVTSALAGKPLENIKQAKDIMICNTLTGYIDAISVLLTNQVLYHEMAQNGQHFVKENYNWETTTKKLEKILQSTQPKETVKSVIKKTENFCPHQRILEEFENAPKEKCAKHHGYIEQYLTELINETQK
jgi:sugar transferase (PEP-CTERM/EpsH1 system associated)